VKEERDGTIKRRRLHAVTLAAVDRFTGSQCMVKVKKNTRYVL
jgi:hypothetical protein